MKTTTRALHGLLVLVFVLSGALRADADELKVDQRMKILMRILTYDKQLSARQDKGRIFIGVLFSSKDPASTKEKDEVVSALRALKSLKVKGFTLDFAPIAYGDPAGVKAALAGRRAAALYVCAGLGSAVGNIAKLGADEKIATMSGSEPFTRSGLAFAAVAKGDQGQIFVNLGASKKQGLELDAALLRLAVVFK